MDSTAIWQSLPKLDLWWPGAWPLKLFCDLWSVEWRCGGKGLGINHTDICEINHLASDYPRFYQQQQEKERREKEGKRERETEREKRKKEREKRERERERGVNHMQQGRLQALPVPSVLWVRALSLPAAHMMDVELGLHPRSIPERRFPPISFCRLVEQTLIFSNISFSRFFLGVFFWGICFPSVRVHVAWDAARSQLGI